MTDLSFEFRPFDPALDDSAEIARLHLEVRRGQVRDNNNVFSDIYESQVDLGDIAAYYIEPGGKFFVARETTSGNAVSFAGIRNDGEGLGSIMRVATVEEYRGRRLGTEVVQMAVDWSMDNGFSRLKLSTGFKEHARPIYERLGFVVVGTKKGKDWLMERDLATASVPADQT